MSDPTQPRVQLALNVDDLEASIAFYSALFGTEPAKQRAGYANFAISEPALKLVLMENPGRGGTLNHLGVELPDVNAVEAAQARLASSGLTEQRAESGTCCYAVQQKFWVSGPDSEPWEHYTVLADSPTFDAGPGVSDGECCDADGNCVITDTTTTSPATAAACC